MVHTQFAVRGTRAMQLGLQTHSDTSLPALRTILVGERTNHLIFRVGRQWERARKGSFGWHGLLRCTAGGQTQKRVTKDGGIDRTGWHTGLAERKGKSRVRRNGALYMVWPARHRGIRIRLRVGIDGVQHQFAAGRISERGRGED